VRRLRLIGVGCGDPRQLTFEALDALRSLDVVVVTDKGTGDALARAREELLAHHGIDVQVVRVPDPPRDRSAESTASKAGYESAVDAWHAARAEAWAQALREHPGDAGWLVWGDPAFYDSTIRIVERVAALLDLEYDVVPGISSVQVLAARHRVVLHDVGDAVHITTGRELAAAAEAGQTNVVVMLNRDLTPLDDPRFDDWQVWWGANLGTGHEALVAGRVADVRADLADARRTTKERAGWVMDVFRLAGPGSPD
jgi:precorrin-6A synthase